MNMVSIVTWVHFVLYTIPIYVLIAIKVLKWFIRSIDEIRKSFHVEGTKTSKWRFSLGIRCSDPLIMVALVFLTWSSWGGPSKSSVSVFCKPD